MIGETLRAAALFAQLTNSNPEIVIQQDIQNTRIPENCIVIPGRIQCPNFVIERTATNVVDLTGRVPNKKDTDDWVSAIKGFRDGQDVMNASNCSFYNSDNLPFKFGRRFYLVDINCLGDEFNK